MKKKILTALALGAATVATGMASNVHADNVTVTKEEVEDQTKVTTTTTKTEASQEKINQDKQAVSDQQKVVDQSKSDMESAQSTVNSDKSKVESAQNSVDSAKQALDNAKNPQQAVANQESKVQDDQNKVNQDQTNINNTQNDIKNDQANVAQDQQNINNASQKVSDDQKQLNQDQSKLDQAQQTLQNDQNKVNDTQNQLNKVNDQINNQVGNVPTTQVPQDYKDRLKNDNETFDNVDQFNKFGDELIDASNKFDDTFVPSPDDNYKVDPSNLTQDQKNELNIYAAQIINGIRQQFGTTPVKTNEAIIDLADQVAKNYDSDNWNTEDDHDSDPNSINGHDGNALGNQNLNDNPYNITWTRGSQDKDFFEEVGSSPNSFDYNDCTMNDLKKQILYGIDACFYNDTDPNWNHAKVIAGLSGGTYVGTSVDKYGNVHFEFSDDYAEQSTVNAMNKTNVPIPLTSDLQNQKNSLENQLAQQKQQVANDQQTVNDLQNQVNADKEQIKNDTPTALQQKLEQDQKKLSDDQNKLNDLQKQLTQDQNQLSQDQAKLDELKKAQVSPEEIQKAQDAYNDAVKALNDAQSQMNKDSDTLAKAQQAYIDAQNKLNELETILKNDEKTVTTVDVQWIKHPHTTAEMGNKVVLSSSHQNTSSAVTMPAVNIVSSTVSENNKVKASNEVNNSVHADSVSEVKTAQATTVKSDDNSNVIYFTSEAPQSSLKKEAKQNTMPQMGDENSNKTVWGEISLAMAGVLATLGLAKRKRHE